jgi:hypothetical protein
VSVRIEQQGAKYYLLGNTFPIKDKLKAAGCRWDPSQRAWWTHYEDVAEGFVNEQPDVCAVDQQSGIESPAAATPVAPPPADAALTAELSAAVCTHRVKYQGRTYYVIGEADEARVWRLTPLSGSHDIWVGRAECEVLKKYATRTYNGQVVKHTVGSLRKFVQESREKGKASGTPAPVESQPSAASLQQAAAAVSHTGRTRPECRTEARVRCRHCDTVTLRELDWCVNCRKAGFV